MIWKMDAVLKLIKAYRLSPCLWNCRDKGYKSVNVRKSAWLNLSKKFGKSVPELKAKLKYMRSAYVEEKKKSDCSEDHQARLYYYNEFRFLDDLIVLRKPNRFEALNSSSAKRTRSVSPEPQNAERATPITDFETPVKERQSISSPGNNTRYKIVQPEHAEATVEDDVSTLSAAWGLLFRKITPEQQLYANKTILSVLYQGALGNLDQFSYKIIDNEHSSNDDFQFEKC